MTMHAPLQIDSAEAIHLAESLAAESGESIAHAVTEALRMRLDKIRRERAWTPDELHRREQEFYEIVNDSRARWPGGLTSTDIDDLLYDEYGLPR